MRTPRLAPAPRAGDPAHVHLRVAAVAAEVATVRHAVDRSAEAHGIGGAARNDIALAVSEACTDVVMHAYRDVATPGPLGVQAYRDHRGFVVVVRDEGRGMTPRTDSPGLGLGSSSAALRRASRSEPTILWAPWSRCSSTRRRRRTRTACCESDADAFRSHDRQLRRARMDPPAWPRLAGDRGLPAPRLPRRSSPGVPRWEFRSAGRGRAVDDHRARGLIRLPPRAVSFEDEGKAVPGDRRAERSARRRRARGGQRRDGRPPRALSRRVSRSPPTRR